VIAEVAMLRRSDLVICAADHRAVSIQGQPLDIPTGSEWTVYEVRKSGYMDEQYAVLMSNHSPYAIRVWNNVKQKPDYSYVQDHWSPKET